MNSSDGQIAKIAVSSTPDGFGSSDSLQSACRNCEERIYAAVAGIRAGVVDIPLALLGAVAVQFVRLLLPYAMGFATGAMFFVISDEIILETHIRGYERVVTLGLMAGVVVMLYLDVSLR